MKPIGHALMAFVMLLLAINLLIAVQHLRRLDARVDCLEHPHGESSIAATRINGRLVITQPVARTGCR